jgi:hypothetical protein
MYTINGLLAAKDMLDNLEDAGTTPPGTTVPVTNHNLIPPGARSTRSSTSCGNYVILSFQSTIYSIA